MTREEAGFLGARNSCSLGRAAEGRAWDLRGRRRLSEPQASRAEAGMPQPPSPPALQAPADSPTWLKPTRSGGAAFRQSWAQPPCTEQSGRRRSRAAGAQRTTSSEPSSWSLTTNAPWPLAFGIVSLSSENGSSDNSVYFHESLLGHSVIQDCTSPGPGIQWVLKTSME